MRPENYLEFIDNTPIGRPMQFILLIGIVLKEVQKTEKVFLRDESKLNKHTLKVMQQQINKMYSDILIFKASTEN